MNGLILIGAQYKRGFPVLLADVICLPRQHNVEMGFTSLLTAREEGDVPPWLPPVAYGSQRLARLELSKEKTLARAHSKTVSSLDIDASGR